MTTLDREFYNLALRLQSCANNGRRAAKVIKVTILVGDDGTIAGYTCDSQNLEPAKGHKINELISMVGGDALVDALSD